MIKLTLLLGELTETTAEAVVEGVTEGAETAGEAIAEATEAVVSSAVNNEELMAALAAIQESLQARPLMTTPFEEYTVLEGLLLLIFIVLFFSFVIDLVRRWL